MINENYLLYLYGIAAMVTSETDTGLPDPSNSSNNDFSISNDEVILFSDNDEEFDRNEVIQFDQYQPLPIEESTELSNESSDDESPIDVNASVPTDIPQIVPAEEIILKEVWSGPPPKMSDIEMDSEKVDEVKQAMANITLPSTAIPEWAMNIPEEDWKQELLERIEKLKRVG